jgi:anti-anti-sigma factor
MADLEPGKPPGIDFQVGSDGPGTAVIRISGELDIANVDALQRAVEPVIAKQPDRLVIDVGDLRFADSSAIALWVQWAGSVPDFELRDPSPLLRRVISSMGLDEKLGPQA